MAGAYATIASANEKAQERSAPATTPITSCCVNREDEAGVEGELKRRDLVFVAACKLGFQDPALPAV
jgi:hypothetical protein